MKAEKSRHRLPDHSLMFDEETQPYRWFLLPSEAAIILANSNDFNPHHCSRLPFCPSHFLNKITQEQGPVNEDNKFTVKRKSEENIFEMSTDFLKATISDGGDEQKPCHIATRISEIENAGIDGISEETGQSVCCDTYANFLQHTFERGYGDDEKMRRGGLR